MPPRWPAAVAVLLGACAASCDRPADPIEVRRPDIHLAADSTVEPGIVPPRTNLGALLRAHELGDADVEGVIASIREVFDPRKLREGRPYRLERADTGELRALEYEIDAYSFLRVLPGGDAAVPFIAEVVPYEIDSAPAVVDGAIDRDTPSLFAAMDAAGETVELTLALAEIFAGEMDFNSEVQPGDRFSLAVNRQTRDGLAIGYGPVTAARFVNGDRVLEAVRFEPRGGKPDYFDAKGRSLRRFFLRSPLKFDPTVTSHFSRSRLHPVLNIRRAHLGVDYRAPHGAPVVAVSAGVVTMAAWTRGGGRTVKIRHASGYETSYLHLSAMTVRRGAHVSQGQIIGRVGNTGLVTGTHLHYEMRRDGRHVNPLTEHRRLPPGDPVPAGQMDAFIAVRDEQLARLPARPPAGDAVVAAAAGR